MKITKLSAAGLKAGDFSHDLGAVTVIAGDNFKGKTSRLEAVRLALMGYLPELGNKPALTMQLARGATMGVRVELEDGRSIEQGWSIQQGQVKTKRLAGELDVPPVLLDPNEYFSLGDKDRMRYVFSRANVELLQDGDEAKAVADVIIANLKRIKIEGHSEQHEQVINNLVTEIDDSDRARHDAGEPVQAWLDQIVNHIREQFKGAKQTADRMAKTTQGLTAVRATEDQAAAENMEKAIAAVRVKIQELTAKQAVHQERWAQMKANDAERARLTKIQQACPSYVDVIALLEKDLELVNTKLAEPVNSLDIEAKERLAKAFQDEIDAYKSETLELGQKFNLAGKDEYVAQNNLDNLNLDIEQRQQKHNEALALDCCPFCKTKKKGWQKAIQDEFEAWMAEQSAAVAKAKEYLAQCAKQVSERQAALEQSNKLDAEFQAKRDQVSKLCREIRELRAALDQERSTLAGKAREITAKIADFRAKQQAGADAKSKLEALPPALSEAEAMEMVMQGTRFTDDLRGLNTELDTMDRQQREYHQSIQDEKRNAQILLEAGVAKASCEVLRETVKMLEALQAKVVEQAFRTILERANKFYRYIALGDLEYRDGEIGRFQGGTWISHKTFSGAEQALCYAGISMALAADSPIKVVLLDELSRFDTETLKKVLSRMGGLVNEGIIDQFIGAGTRECLPVAVTDPDATVIEL
jgi:DNA repair exonuclease SbcCD ATPase subunit